ALHRLAGGDRAFALFLRGGGGQQQDHGEYEDRRDGEGTEAAQRQVGSSVAAEGFEDLVGGCAHCPSWKNGAGPVGMVAAVCRAPPLSSTHAPGLLFWGEIRSGSHQISRKSFTVV